MSIQYAVGTRSPSTSTPHWPACGFVKLLRLRRHEARGCLPGPAHPLGGPSVSVISARLANRCLISARYADAESRCRLGRKCWAIGPYAGKTRCACPTDFNPCMRRSRWRVGRCEFSHRLEIPVVISPPASPCALRQACLARMEKATCVMPNTQMYERGSLPGNSAAQERVKWGEPYRLHAQPGGKIQFKMAGIQVSPHAFPSVHTRQQPGRVMCASSSPPHPNKRPNVHIVAIPIRHKLYILHLLKPTVSLDVIALVACSCGYSRGHIEPHAAQ